MVLRGRTPPGLRVLDDGAENGPRVYLRTMPIGTFTPGHAMYRRSLAVLALGLAACTPKFTVTNFSDAAVPLPAGATWAWGHTEQTYPAERDRLANDPEIYRLITAAVEREMAARGYQRTTDTLTATLLVHFHVGVQRQREQTQDQTLAAPGVCASDYCRAGVNWGAWGVPSTGYGVIEFREAGLVVDLFDRASNRLAWRGYLKTRIENVAETYEQRERNLNDATKRVMKDLPSR